jgi:hypothetical protein
MEGNMDAKELGRLTYEISPDALKEIVATGKVVEFANTVAASAASEIHAQIVDQIAQAAVEGGGARGVSVGAVNVFEGGDFGTVPIGPGGRGPRPKISVLIGGNALSHVVDVGAINRTRG